MDFVEGPILRQRPDADAFPDPDDRRAIGERVVDTLVEIHGSVPDEVGLGELGKKEDYVRPASSSAGRDSGRDRRRARSRSSRTSATSSPSGSPSRDRRRSSTATTASTT